MRGRIDGNNNHMNVSLHVHLSIKSTKPFFTGQSLIEMSGDKPQK